MRKLVKVAIAVGTCLVLAGCPRATSVTGLVTGPGAASGVKAEQSLDAELPYRVARGASITVGYDNGKSCTFRGPTVFIPGTDGSVCEKDKKKNDDDDNQDEDQNQQDQNQQDQARQDQPETGQGQQQGSTGGRSATSGINAPAVTSTPSPNYWSGGIESPPPASSGFNGPPVTATGVPTYTRLMQVVSNPILMNTLAVIGAISVAKEVRDQTNGNGGDEPVSK